MFDSVSKVKRGERRANGEEMCDQGWFQVIGETTYFYQSGFDVPVIMRNSCKYAEMLEKEHNRINDVLEQGMVDSKVQTTETDTRTTQEEEGNACPPKVDETYCNMINGKNRSDSPYSIHKCYKPIQVECLKTEKTNFNTSTSAEVNVKGGINGNANSGDISSDVYNITEFFKPMTKETWKKQKRPLGNLQMQLERMRMVAMLIV